MLKTTQGIDNDCKIIYNKIAVKISTKGENSMSKKILSILLAISMMLTILAACNNDPVDNVEDQDEHQGSEEIVLPETLDPLLTVLLNML